jgi:hypothetical protein
MKMNKIQKAKRIVDEARIIFMGETSNYGYFVVIGDSDTYDVIHDKRKDRYSCTCKNIRNTTCSHIEAVKLFVGDTE